MHKALEKIILHESVKKTTIFLKDNKKTVLTLLVTFIFADIFFVKVSSDFIIFSILFIYIFFSRMFQITSRFTFLLCLAQLIAMFINYLLSGASVPTEKAAVWFVLFLAVGIIQQWRE